MNVRSTRLASVLVVFGVLGASCSDGNGITPPPPRDSSVDPDGGRDGAPPDMDAGMDAAVDTGVVVTDGGGLDATLPDVVIIEPEEDSGVGRGCSSGSCGPGTVCLSDGAGGMTCQPSGHGCLNDDDCPASSDCLEGTPAVCDHGAPMECADSRDCPRGYACESGGCTDRRTGCDMDTQLCPFGFVCFRPQYTEEPFCVRASPRCASEFACLPGQSCEDAAADGDFRCMGGRDECKTNGDCTTAGEVCGTDPELGLAACGPHGACAGDGDCATGYGCVDLWGDGVTECVPSGGTCRSLGDCGGGGICGSPEIGAAPECHDEPF